MTGSIFFSRRELSGRELPGGELSLWGSFPGGNCPGEIIREGIGLELNFYDGGFSRGEFAAGVCFGR